MVVVPAVGSLWRWSYLRQWRQNELEHCLIGKNIPDQPSGASSAWKSWRTCPGPPQCSWHSPWSPWTCSWLVGIDQPLHTKEGSSHLLRASGMNLGLNRAWQSLPKPLFWLLLGLSSVIWQYWLILSDNIVHHRQWLPLGHRQQGSHLLQFLLLAQKLGDPSWWPLCEAKVFRKEVLKGLNRYHMGWSQYFYADTKIFFYVGGNSGNENRNSCCILWVEMPLVLVTFSSLNILYNGKICCLLQWLVPINNVRGLFYFFIAFAGSGEVSDKVPHPSHTYIAWLERGTSTQLSFTCSSPCQLIWRDRNTK